MCVMHGWDGLQARVLADDAGTVLVMGGPLSRIHISEASSRVIRAF